jgi:hypothetical protein
MRFRSALISLVAVALAAPSALAQSTPEATLARFIELANAGELTTGEGQAILTGEAKEMATAAKSNLPAADKVVAVSPNFAAARIVLRSPAGEEANAYFYLEKTAAGWAVSAFRQMAVSGMDMMLLAEMRKQKQLPPDDQQRRRNLELTLSTDSWLRAWFGANQQALDNLRPLSADLATLGLLSVSETEHGTKILVGKTLDSTVGFLRAGPSGPPTISPSSYIWIEELGDGWFLFRTT